MYIIADNCDGKQARRTGSSSPMGMLFDHGVDAFVAICNNFMLLRLFCVGPNPYQLLTQMCATFPFYFVTLEQYYTGEMNFPPINGIDEGSLVISGLAILTGFYGNLELWGTETNMPYVGKVRYS
jgi:ethanolaminephosphotransferase